MPKVNNEYDEALFNKAYDKYSVMIYRLCLVQLKTKEDAEDALQNVFIKYMYNSPEFKSEEHEKAWIIRVALNVCRNVQKNFWRNNISSIDELAENGIEFSEQEEGECLLDMFSLLEKHRTVLYLYYYEGYSISQIADIIGQKERSVSSLLSRARKALKTKMEVHGYEWK